MRLEAAALQRIEAAVKDAERSTAGEIVVVVAPHSASWGAVRTALALPVAALGGALLDRVVEMDAGWMALAVTTLFVIAWLLAGAGPITRWLAGSGGLDAAVLRAAKVAFVDHGVHATKARAGVLVYLSLLERRVQVLGDAGVHAIVGDAGWASVAARVSGAMKGNNIDALIDVVRDVGATLAKAFPRAPNDENELPDAVRTGRRTLASE